MADNEPQSLGSWKEADLKGTVAQYAGKGSDDDMDRISRFGRSVAQLGLRRMRQHLGTMRRDAIAIFLLEPNGPPGMSLDRQPMLGDGGIELCGKIWFANVDAQSGRSLTPPSEADGDMFDHVEKLGFGNITAAIFNPTIATPIVRLYPQGLGAGDAEFIAFEVDDREVTIDDIRLVIDDMYKKHLCTPGAQLNDSSIWADAQKFWANRKAESIAQLHMKIELAARLFNCEIRHEQPMKGGRVDLEVVQNLANGASIIPAEIEIKILRERRETGRKWGDAKTVNWIRRGIRQAAAYRDERKAKVGMLCCFDMREGDRGDTGAFAPVQPYADSLGVILHRNFLYNDADKYRLAKYGP